ncbi:MAG: hypothetical protein K9J30_12390 [Bacteroidales bacterium]|nr:hypothetical protein [Bacteroidales bacterium]
MKKRINKFIYVLVAVLMVTSCEWDPIKFDSSKSYVAYTAPTAAIAEEGGAVPIPVIVTALLDAPAVTVTFEFDTAGIDPAKAAFEGTDYTLVNSEKTLSFPDGWGYDTVWIQPIDNDIFTGDKYFNAILTANSADYQFGAADTVLVTLKDNEHPLGNWIGTYAVDAKSYGLPGDWDEAWTVSTAPDPEDVTVLLLNGIGGPDYSSFTNVPAVVDKDAMTITITAGSEIGTHGLYGGPLAIFLGDEAGGIANETDPMVGEISEDGSIHIDHMAIKFVGGINTGYVWDSFDTYWTKASRKSVKDGNSSSGRPGLIEQ